MNKKEIKILINKIENILIKFEICFIMQKENKRKIIISILEKYQIIFQKMSLA